MNLTNPEQRDAFINEQEVFKVVDCYLQSCSAVGDYRVQFRLGEFVTAPLGTKFFVFESLMHAKDFRKSDLHLCILWQPREAYARQCVELATRGIRLTSKISGESTISAGPTVSSADTERHLARYGPMRFGWMNVFRPQRANPRMTNDIFSRARTQLGRSSWQRCSTSLRKASL